MESCEICGQDRAADDDTVRCSGPCGGTVHACCANAAGIMVATKDDDLYWFCDRCRRDFRPVTSKYEGWLELPPEMWTKIFEQLSAIQLLKMRLVCRHWRDIAVSSVALRGRLGVKFPEMVPFDGDYVPFPALLPVAKARFEKLSIKGICCKWWPAFGQGLTEIQIDNCNAILPAVIEMLQHTPNLSCLGMDRVHFSGQLTEGTDFHLQKLKTLYIDAIEIFKDLPFFEQLCGNLKYLKMYWESYETSLKAAEFIGYAQNTLEELNISICDEMLLELMELDGLKLRKLTVYGDGLENSQLLIDFFGRHPSLEELNVIEIIPLILNKTDLKKIGQLLPKLKSLATNLVPDLSVDLSFLSHMAQLQSLELDGIEYVFPSYVIGNQHLNLKSLTLACIRFGDNCLQPLLSRMPNLRTFILESSCTVTSWSDLLKAIESLKFLHRLTLNFSFPNGSSLCDIGDLANLKYLKLNVHSMPHETLAAFLGRCPGLRVLHIDIADEKLNEDEVIRVICRKLPQLNQLTVGRRNLSEASQSYIRENCASLYELKVEL